MTRQSRKPDVASEDELRARLEDEDDNVEIRIDEKVRALYDRCGKRHAR